MMKNIRAGGSSLVASARPLLLSASLCLIALANIGPANCEDDPGFFGSVQVAASARKAARAMKTGSFGEAQSEYRRLLGKDDDFCFGLYEASRNLKHWDQCALALEQLFEKRPNYKNQLSYEYGETLFNLNRYDEAEQQLKLALSKVNEPSVLSSRLKTLYAKSDPPELPPEVGPIIAVKPQEIPVVVPPPVLSPTAVNEDTEKALNYTNAFMKSETIVVAEYKGFEKNEHIGFYDPPVAIFKVVDSLKGSRLNRNFPIKFEFRNKIAADAKPDGWKWSPELMPAVGSKWIIFIANAVAVEGAYETFHGAYGRQEANEKNLDEINRIIQEHQGQAK